MVIERTQRITSFLSSAKENGDLDKMMGALQRSPLAVISSSSEECYYLDEHIIPAERRSQEEIVNSQVVQAGIMALKDDAVNWDRNNNRLKVIWGIVDGPPAQVHQETVLEKCSQPPLDPTDANQILHDQNAVSVLFIYNDDDILNQWIQYAKQMPNVIVNKVIETKELPDLVREAIRDVPCRQFPKRQEMERFLSPGTDDDHDKHEENKVFYIVTATCAIGGAIIFFAIVFHFCHRVPKRRLAKMEQMKSQMMSPHFSSAFGRPTSMAPAMTSHQYSHAMSSQPYFGPMSTAPGSLSSIVSSSDSKTKIPPAR